jgi:hypothetical protein
MNSLLSLWTAKKHYIFYKDSFWISKVVGAVAVNPLRAEILIPSKCRSQIKSTKAPDDLVSLFYVT